MMKKPAHPFIGTHELPQPTPEYKFCPTRRWRIDWAWPDVKLAVEIEGGLWISGRHNRAASMIKDMEKYNTLTLMGWRLLRFTPQQVNSGYAADIINKFFSFSGPLWKRRGVNCEGD